MPLPPVRIVIAGVDKFSGKFDQAGAKIRSIGGRMTEFGSKMTTRVSLPIAAAGTAIFKTAMDFDTAMNRVEAKTQASSKQMDNMRQMARDLGETTTFSATQAGEAMGFLGQAGWDVNQIMQGTPHLLDLAASSEMELGRAADITSNIMGAFRKEASDTKEVVDVLAATTSSSNVDMEMLGETMQHAAPVAKAAGASLRDAAAAAGFLGNIGIQGSKAGTAMKNMFARLANQTPKATKALAKVGVTTADLTDAEGNLRPYSQIIQEMSAGLAELGSGDRIGVIQDVFGLRAMPGVTALAEDMAANSSNFEKLADSLENVNGRAGEMADTMLKGAPGAFKKMKSALESAALSIAESGFIDMMTNIIEKLTDMFRWVADVNPGILRFGTVIAIAAMLIGPVIVAIGSLVTAIGVLNAAIFSIPVVGWILALVAAIIAAVAIIVANWEWFKKRFIDLWVAIKFSAPVQWFLGFIELVKKAIRWINIFMRGGKDKLTIEERKQFQVGEFSKEGRDAGEVGRKVGGIDRLQLDASKTREEKLLDRDLNTMERFTQQIAKTNKNNSGQMDIRFENAPQGMRVDRVDGSIGLDILYGNVN